MRTAFIAGALLLATTASAQTSDDAFQGVLDAIEAGRQMILSRTTEDGPERAEGLRWVLRLIEFQNGTWMDDHDPAHPHITRCPTIVCKVGFDNPDFTYINVSPLSGEYTYRIYGQRGTVPYVSMQVFDNPLGGGSFMTAEDLVVNEDGSYEIILSPTRPDDADNWLELRPNATRFLLRNGFYDWNNEVEASVQVEIIAGPMSGPVPNLTPEEFVSDAGTLASRLMLVPTTILNASDGWPLNDVNDPDPGAFGIPGAGVPSAVSSAGRYELATDEALIIETPNPDVVHGGIQLGNIWVESLDYQTRQTSLNWFQSTADSDGIIRYVLAHEDPGVPNWLDISDHPRGTIFFRWQSPSDENYPSRPIVTKVAASEIRANLPADHPTVTPAERAEILKARFMATNLRRNPSGQFDVIQAAANLGIGSGDDGGGGCAVSLRSPMATPLAFLVLVLATMIRRRRS